MRILRTSLFIVLASMTAASFGQALKPGSPAPALSVGSWVKGKPVNSFKKGEVYVVEFWATWCGPCIQSIPHISKLAKQYDKKATFVGVSVWESKPTDYKTKVPAFVKKMGDKMSYNVATDNSKMDMANKWMKAAGQNGIPTAFIVGKDGNVAWIGHPMEMDQPLADIVAGKFDSKAYAEAAAQKMAAEEEQNAKFAPLSKALEAQDHKTALAEIDKIIASDPNMEVNLAQVRVMCLASLQDSSLGNYLLACRQSGMFKEAEMMNGLVWYTVGSPKLQNQEAYEAALVLAKDMEASGTNLPALMDTIGLAYFKNNQRAKALEIQKKAVALAAADKQFDANMLAELKLRLKMYGG
jgi:thiol-disulfide isomerase/thioredoxin